MSNGGAVRSQTDSGVGQGVKDMTFFAKLEDADGGEVIPLVRVTLREGPKGWQGSLTLPPDRSEGNLPVPDHSPNANYAHRLVAIDDGRAVRIRLCGSETTYVPGTRGVEVEFVAEGPLTEPPADE